MPYRTVVYGWQEHDEQFAQEYRQAEIEATETLEAEAFRRAHDGVAEPVFHQGVEVGTVQKYSDTLLIFMLKARNPAKYREKHEGAADGQQPVKVVDREAYEAI